MFIKSSLNANNLKCLVTSKLMWPVLLSMVSASNCKVN